MRGDGGGVTVVGDAVLDGGDGGSDGAEFWGEVEMRHDRCLRHAIRLNDKDPRAEEELLTIC